MSETLHRGRLNVIVLSILAAACFIALAKPAPTEAGDVAFLEVSFADSFAVEWVGLSLVQGDTPVPKLLPMAGAEGLCIGFARTDWPQPTTHPSVARCFTPPQPGAVSVRPIATGPITWHIFAFGAPVRDVDVTVEGVRNTHYQGSSIAAAALPSGVEDVELEWTEPSGRRFKASITGLEGVAGL